MAKPRPHETIAPRRQKHGEPRHSSTYRWHRRNTALHPLTKVQRRDLIRAGHKRGSH